MSAEWFIVDAHEDLACHCIEMGRDIYDPAAVPCMLTLPWLIENGVRLICATLFVPHEYPHELRRAKLEEQYALYQSWLQRYPELLKLVRNRADLQGIVSSQPLAPGDLSGHPLGMVLLMEGCDLLESPAELELWYGRGLRMAGLTWNGVNRYASGCFGDGRGLSPLGRELLSEFRRLGVILDLSHLTDQGVEDVLSSYDGAVVATHSNSRALCQHERNLTDAQIREIGARDGVIGLNLLASFITTGWQTGNPLPQISAALAHTERIAELIGWERVGLGSDLDGGLTPQNTPEGIDTIRDVSKLFECLLQRGLERTAVAGFAGANWRRFFERSLPA